MVGTPSIYRALVSFSQPITVLVNRQLAVNHSSEMAKEEQVAESGVTVLICIPNIA